MGPTKQKANQSMSSGRSRRGVWAMAMVWVDEDHCRVVGASSRVNATFFERGFSAGIAFLGPVLRETATLLLGFLRSLTGSVKRAETCRRCKIKEGGERNSFSSKTYLYIHNSGKFFKQ